VNPPARLPDFLIVGAMKAGTTSLFDWLGFQPDVFVPKVKEPNFFSQEHLWSKGIDWYSALFCDAAPDQHIGEASVGYTDPTRSAVTASRIAKVLPDVSLVFVARDPVERARSHYRHEVLRGREKRSLAEALASKGSPYVERSLYHECLAPYLERFPRERICVVTFESLFGQAEAAWTEVVSFIGLDPRARPATHRNSSAERQQFSPTMRFLWDAGLRRVPRVAPSFARRAVKPLLFRRSADPLLQTAEDAFPEATIKSFGDDAERLRRWVGAQSPYWSFETAEIG
jgi:hypothetical protein